MESIISSIAAIWAGIKVIDWGAFFLWWLSIERVLKEIAKRTPWGWDDDLVEWLSNVLKKKNPSG